MAAKRRRKRQLGWTPGEHRTRMGQAGLDLETALHNLERAGNCRGRFAALTHAHETAGELFSHAQAYIRNSPKAEGDRARVYVRELARRLERAKAGVQKRCLRGG